MGNGPARTNAERLVLLEQQVGDVLADLTDIRQDVREIRDRFGDRPSWLVTLALTFMASMIVGLAVAAITIGGQP